MIPVAWFVSQSVCLSVSHVAMLCKSAEWIEVLFEVESLGDPRHATLNGGPNHSCVEGTGELGENFWIWNIVLFYAAFAKF